MGLSSMPSPSDSVLTMVVANTALSISLLREILRSILHTFGLDRYCPADPDESDDDGGLNVVPYPANSSSSSSSSPSSVPPQPTVARDSLAHRFRAQFKAARFDKWAHEHHLHHADCRVCLALFDPDSSVNRLPCGHLFHAGCLDRWLGYHHATCPLCRTRIFTAASAADGEVQPTDS